MTSRHAAHSACLRARPPIHLPACLPALARYPCSLGIILYELLHRKMIVADLMNLGDPSAAMQHAYNVSAHVHE